LTEVAARGTIILKVRLRGGSKNILTGTMPVAVDWGGGVFADCLLRVQLLARTMDSLI